MVTRSDRMTGLPRILEHTAPAGLEGHVGAYLENHRININVRQVFEGQCT